MNANAKEEWTVVCTFCNKAREVMKYPDGVKGADLAKRRRYFLFKKWGWTLAMHDKKRRTLANGLTGGIPYYRCKDCTEKGRGITWEQ